MLKKRKSAIAFFYWLIVSNASFLFLASWPSQGAPLFIYVLYPDLGFYFATSSTSREAKVVTPFPS